MKLLRSILSTRKPFFLARFLSVIRRSVPKSVEPPTDPGEALQVGYRLGLQEGYGEGFVDGAGLGVEVGASDVVVDEPEVH